MCTPQYFSKIPFAVTYHIHYFNAIHFERKKNLTMMFPRKSFCNASCLFNMIYTVSLDREKTSMTYM